jgi:hypothetical protein
MLDTLKQSRKLLILAMLSMFILVSGCQHKGIIRCPKPAGKRSKINIKGPNSQDMQGISVPMGKDGRVKKKRGIFNR